jgi:hypothetical protein
MERSFHGGHSLMHGTTKDMRKKAPREGTRAGQTARLGLGGEISACCLRETDSAGLFRTLSVKVGRAARASGSIQDPRGIRPPNLQSQT